METNEQKREGYWGWLSGHKIRKAGRCFLLGLGEIIYGPKGPIAYYVLGGGRGFGGEYTIF